MDDLYIAQLKRQREIIEQFLRFQEEYLYKSKGDGARTIIQVYVRMLRAATATISSLITYLEGEDRSSKSNMN